MLEELYIVASVDAIMGNVSECMLNRSKIRRLRIVHFRLAWDVRSRERYRAPRLQARAELRLIRRGLITGRLLFPIDPIKNAVNK